MAEPGARLEPGRIWSGYVVDSMLGEGARGAVYLVQRTTDRSYWALKVLDTTDGRQKVRVEQEAIFRDELRHPHIVPAVESIEVDGHPGLIMDFVEGPTLDAWVERYDPDMFARLQVFRLVLDAVHFAHDHGVIHRDLKPSNILLQPDDGDGFIPRVADFGLGKALAPEMGKFGGLTTVNTGLGTAGYAAPEQMRDASSVDERADLFSLGCILYELVCGTGPFAGLSTFEVLRASAGGEYPPPTPLAPWLPSDILALTEELLAPDPAERPRSAAEVCTRVDAVLTTIRERMEEADEAHDEDEDGPSLSVPLELGALVAVPAVAMVVGALVVLVT